jgi:hypothetical protein
MKVKIAHLKKTVGFVSFGFFSGSPDSLFLSKGYKTFSLVTDTPGAKLLSE